jgi:hypothetical protein
MRFGNAPGPARIEAGALAFAGPSRPACGVSWLRAALRLTASSSNKGLNSAARLKCLNTYVLFNNAAKDH